MYGRVKEDDKSGWRWTKKVMEEERLWRKYLSVLRGPDKHICQIWRLSVVEVGNVSDRVKEKQRRIIIWGGIGEGVREKARGGYKCERGKCDCVREGE